MIDANRVFVDQLLNDVDQLQLSARPWSGGSSSSSRRKYPLVTLSNVKGALLSRSSSVHCDLPQLSTKLTTADRSKDTERRKHAPNSNNNELKPAKRQEIIVRSSSSAPKGTKKAKKVLLLSDLRDEVSTPPAADSSQSSNQKLTSSGRNASNKDPVLNYHVRLAHSWQHYQVG